MTIGLGIGLGITIGGNGGGGTPAPSSKVFAANRFGTMTGTNTYTAPYTSRRHHYASTEGDVEGIILVEANWILTQTGATTACTARQFKKFIEYPATVFHSVSYAGDFAPTIASGGLLSSDPVISSVTGLPLKITAGAIWYERTVLLTSITDMPNYVLQAGSTVLGIPDGNVANDSGNTGTISATTGTRTFGAIAALGTINGVSGKRSFLIWGDSLADGVGDATSAGTKGASGYPARLVDKYGYGYVKLAIGNLFATGVAANIADTRLVALMAVINTYFTDGWNELGVNDIGSTGTPSSILALYQTIYTTYFTGKQIHQSTISTRNDSTDSFATEANQTVKAQGNMAQLGALNTAIAGLAPGVRIIDAFAADCANGSFPNAHSGPPYPMVLSDGVHFVSGKAANMATALTIV